MITMTKKVVSNTEIISTTINSNKNHRNLSHKIEYEPQHTPFCCEIT